jgi:hypothetical protein
MYKMRFDEDPEVAALVVQMLQDSDDGLSVTAIQNLLQARHHGDGVAMLGTLAGVAYTTIMATVQANGGGLHDALKLAAAFHVIICRALVDIHGDDEPPSAKH